MTAGPPLLPLLLLLLLRVSAGMEVNEPQSSYSAASGPAAGLNSTDPAADLTARYAANGTWTEAGLVRLAADMQLAASGHEPAPCHDQPCPPPPPCRSASELLAALGDGAASVQSLCPAVLQQSQAPGCLARLAQHTQKPRVRPRPAEVWGYGLLFVTLISLSSIFAVLLLPMLGRACFERLMPGLIGLAVGSLASSALFHLIPQAFELVVDGAGHGYLNTALFVLAGAWFFFMLERMMKISLDYKKRRSGEAADASRLDGVLGTPATDDPASSRSSSTAADIGCTLSVPATSEVKRTHQEPVRAMFGQVEEKPHSRHHHDHELALTHSSGAASEIAVVAWMIIFGDGFHNFLDGLGIGAAFSENILTGVSISVAVLCEELPHELGDFAVLLDAGMTVRQAVVYNFLSACTCYLGLVLGILIGDFTESTSFVFALAAGMFLYISLVDMVPEMNEAAEKASGISVYHGLRVLLVQNIGIMVGCFTLFVLAYYADSLALD